MKPKTEAERVDRPRVADTFERWIQSPLPKSSGQDCEHTGHDGHPHEAAPGAA